MRTPSSVLVLSLALVLALSSVLPVRAAQDFDPNSVTCADVIRNENGLADLTTLFTYAFLSGVDFAEGNPVSALDRDTFEATSAAVDKICRAYPEKTVLEMIAIGLSGKPQTPQNP